MYLGAGMNTDQNNEAKLAEFQNLAEIFQSRKDRLDILIFESPPGSSATEAGVLKKMDHELQEAFANLMEAHPDDRDVCLEKLAFLHDQTFSDSDVSEYLQDALELVLKQLKAIG